jgi:hypothetical protein
VHCCELEVGSPRRNHNECIHLCYNSTPFESACSDGDRRADMPRTLTLVFLLCRFFHQTCLRRRRGSKVGSPKKNHNERCLPDGAAEPSGGCRSL